jgi:predicted ATPase
MLEAAPDLKILATSRARLNLQAEHLLPVPGMDYPEVAPGATQPAHHLGDAVPPIRGAQDAAQPVRQAQDAAQPVRGAQDAARSVRQAQDAAQYSAVQLFLSSARRAQPGFALTATNLADVIRICRLVDGMPLALLLAAAWVGMLTPAEIAAEIGRGLDFLEADLRDLPQRQRSVRAVYNHSWELLTERERAVFAGLCVFRGGFTRDAAQRVTGASLLELKSLADGSLLHRTPTPSAALRTGGRYEIHELLRQYGEEQLARTPEEGQAARDRHCAYYVAALERWSKEMESPRQASALAEMEAEIGNAQAAWARALERGDAAQLGHALDGFWWLYILRARYREAAALCREAAEVLEGAASVDALRILITAQKRQGLFECFLGHTARSHRLLEASLALLDHPVLAGVDMRAQRASVLYERGALDYQLGGSVEDHQHAMEESLALFQALGDHWMMGWALEDLGVAAEQFGQLHRAEELYERALQVRRAVGEPTAIAGSLSLLGCVAGARGQVEKAERLLREAIEFYQESGNQVDMALANQRLCRLYRQLGRYDEVCSIEERNIAILQDFGRRLELAVSQGSLAQAKLHLGAYTQAQAQAQAALATSREIDRPRDVADALGTLSQAALARGPCAEAQRLLDKDLALRPQGARSRDEAGRTLVAMALVACSLGQNTKARQHLCQAVQTALPSEDVWLLPTTLPALALWLAGVGEIERGVALYALASGYPFVAHSRWYEDVVGKPIAAAAAALPAKVVAAAQERGRAMDPKATARELLAELAGLEPAG